MSQLEDTLLLHIVAAKLPRPEREYRFHPVRKWRTDFAWVPQRLIVEVEGGTFVRGRHSRPVGIRKDAEKYNEMALLGWRLLRVTPDMIRDGSALEVIERALKGAVANG